MHRRVRSSAGLGLELIPTSSASGKRSLPAFPWVDASWRWIYYPYTKEVAVEQTSA